MEDLWSGEKGGVNFPLIVSQLAVLTAWNEESASVGKSEEGWRSETDMEE